MALYNVSPFVSGFFYSVLFVRFTRIFLQVVVDSSFSLLCSILLHEYTIIYLSILLLLDIWAVSSLGLLRIMLLRTS